MHELFFCLFVLFFSISTFTSKHPHFTPLFNNHYHFYPLKTLPRQLSESAHAIHAIIGKHSCILMYAASGGARTEYQIFKLRALTTEP